MKTAPLIVLRTLYDFCAEKGFKHTDMIIAAELLNGQDKIKRSYTVYDIKTEVYKYFDLKEWEVENYKKVGSRKRHLVEARQIAMALSVKHKKPGWTYRMIGDEIGGYDHSTVIHSYKMFENHYRFEKKYRNHIKNIETVLFQKYKI